MSKHVVLQAARNGLLSSVAAALLAGGEAFQGPFLGPIVMDALASLE
jgi:hypothetical protein